MSENIDLVKTVPASFKTILAQTRNISAKGNQKRACTVLEIRSVLENLYFNY